MNILDENVSSIQRQLLQDWGIQVRHIGYGIGRKGMQDDEIIPFLLSLSRPTLFTEDWDFYKRDLCHAKYGLVFLDVNRDESAIFIRRLLRYPEFNTQVKRLGKVMRVSYSGIFSWGLRSQQELFQNW